MTESSEEILTPTQAAAATGGLRYNKGKVRTDLLCPIALMAVADVLEKGSRKYAEWNWAKGMKWSIPIGCMLRHLFKFMMGQELDRDENCAGCQKNDCLNHTGLPHVDLIACNAMFLQRYYRNNKDLDDRFKG